MAAQSRKQATIYLASITPRLVHIADVAGTKPICAAGKLFRAWQQVRKGHQSVCFDCKQKTGVK